MEREGVLVIGSANMDLVVNVEKFAKPGETIFGSGFGMFPGGKGANQAVCSAKLGGLTYFIGKMGKDAFREQLVRNMESEGVELNNLLTSDKNSTGIALITVEKNGENEIVVVSGSNMELMPEDLDRKEDLFAKVKCVVCQLEIPLETVEKAAEMAMKNNAQFILNPAPAQILPDRLLSLTDYLTPNENELELLASGKIDGDDSVFELAEKLIDKGVGNVLVTLGPKGVFVANKAARKIIPALEVSVVDTTAAGDAFSGAFAFALSNNYDFENAVKFAVTAASLAVTKMGAQSSMPDFETVNKKLN